MTVYLFIFPQGQPFIFPIYFYAEPVTLDNFIAFPRPFLAEVFLP